MIIKHYMASFLGINVSLLGNIFKRLNSMF
ncbi:rCG38971 [Rattus norvegicus]|uniref:RCG38971 n=1 Tax=Rattus norvegicus TaxID=10116 RepID=A6KLA9_RAT|nr:rCG38971 [Rattus norvegicus]